MAKKTNETKPIVELGPKDQEIFDLNCQIEYLTSEADDLQKQVELLTQQNIQAGERYIKEREHRREVQRENEGLKVKAASLWQQLEATKYLRDAERRKRHGSIPKFVIVAAIALVVLMGSFLLQKLSAIGPSVGYGIQCSMAMIISWCYAIILDRSRKN